MCRSLPPVRHCVYFLRTAFPGGPCDVDDTRAAQFAVLTVQEASARFRGAVCRLITDDKGTRFLIACGVPGFRSEIEANAHSLYASRALQIGLTSAIALRSLGLTPACGIATGPWAT